MQEHELRFTEEEQREVIQLAARLQREQGDTLGTQELIQMAAEAGIEREYVERAIQLRQSPAQEPSVLVTPPVEESPLMPTSAKILAPALLLAQCFVVSRGFFYFAPTSFTQPRTALAVLLAVGIGVSLCRTGRTRKISLAIVLGSLLSASAVFAGILRITQGYGGEHWVGMLLMLAVGEILATVLGWTIGAALPKPRSEDARPSWPYQFRA